MSPEPAQGVAATPTEVSPASRLTAVPQTDDRFIALTDAAKAIAPGFRDDYADLLESWKSIDTKAHSTITSCGIAIAAVMVFLGRPSPSPTSQTLLILIAASVGLSLVASLLALRVRGRIRTAVGRTTAAMVADLIRASEQALDRETLLNFYFNLGSKTWGRDLDDLAKSVDSKANWLFGAHACLCAGFLFLLVLILVSVS